VKVEASEVTILGQVFRIPAEGMPLYDHPDRCVLSLLCVLSIFIVFSFLSYIFSVASREIYNTNQAG
jgi:hypothetical protein